jgi:tripartite-type tricarboxylate transporter receptor subunit TctC
MPVHSVRDLIQVAKARPGQLNFGSAGNGSSLQLALELFKSIAGIDLVHVPYKEGAPATTEIIAGQVQVMMIRSAPNVTHCSDCSGLNQSAG